MKRLIHYRKKADEVYWSEHWEDISIARLISGTNKKDNLLLNVLMKYLPKEGRILDGGCGLGAWVITLKNLGYNIEGIDFSKKLIERIQKHDSTTSVKIGNVLNLDYPDNFFQSYISLGVVEHFEEGPKVALLEAHRVLCNGGVLLVSVPYFNPLRMLKSLLGFYKQNAGEFYQYVFTVKEFSRIIQDCGFHVREVIPYDCITGLKREIFIIRYIYNRIYRMVNAKSYYEKTDSLEKFKSKSPKELKSTIIIRSMLKLADLPVIRRNFAHMALFVAQAQKTHTFAQNTR